MTEPTNAVDSESKCTIFIAHVSELDLWHAVWSNQDGFVADFDGHSEEEAVTWARERCDELWMHRPGDEDYVRLADQDGPGSG